MTAVAETPDIRFENISGGAELWGGTQANFVIHIPGQHAREVAVLVNDPAAAFLAGLLGREDTPESRQQVTRAVGEAWLRQLFASGRHLESLIFLSTVKLQSEPAVLEEVRKQFAAA